MNDIEIRDYQSDQFFVREVVESDREYMKAVAAAEYLFGRLYVVEPEIGIKVYWDEMIKVKGDLNYLAFLNNGDLLGRVALQGINEDYPELAIVIVKEYQSKGYGYLLLKQWLNWVYSEGVCNRINVKIDCDNKKSVGLFKKLGAIVDDEDDIIRCHINLPTRTIS